VAQASAAAHDLRSTALMRGKILAFSAVVEGATGIAFMVAPAIVVRLLVGLDVSTDGDLLGRCFGVALLALSLACWPAANAPSLVRAMTTYNGLIALYLAYVGAVLKLQGLLLWPAVAVHVLVALLLVWPSRKTC
jgi:hypothetical protein